MGHYLITIPKRGYFLTMCIQDGRQFFQGPSNPYRAHCRLPKSPHQVLTWWELTNP